MKNIFKERKKVKRHIHKNKDRDSNEAFHVHNYLNSQTELTIQLEKESKLVAKESMRILRKFEVADTTK